MVVDELGGVESREQSQKPSSELVLVHLTDCGWWHNLRYGGCGSFWISRNEIIQNSCRMEGNVMICSVPIVNSKKKKRRSVFLTLG